MPLPRSACEHGSFSLRVRLAAATSALRVRLAVESSRAADGAATQRSYAARPVFEARVVHAPTTPSRQPRPLEQYGKRALRDVGLGRARGRARW